MSEDTREYRPDVELFIDLDGVLANFDAGVKTVTGQFPWQISVKRMWKALANSSEFFASLELMDDAEELWSYCKPYDPAILTGLPRGNWAKRQKRAWVKKHLGEDVVFYACASRDKYKWSGDDHILIDDRESHRGPWEKRGGIFIHHKSAEETIERLKELGL